MSANGNPLIKDVPRKTKSKMAITSNTIGIRIFSKTKIQNVFLPSFLYAPMASDGGVFGLSMAHIISHSSAPSSKNFPMESSRNPRNIFLNFKTSPFHPQAERSCCKAVKELRISMWERGALLTLSHIEMLRLVADKRNKTNLSSFPPQTECFCPEGAKGVPPLFPHQRSVSHPRRS